MSLERNIKLEKKLDDAADHLKVTKQSLYYCPDEALNTLIAAQQSLSEAFKNMITKRKRAKASE